MQYPSLTRRSVLAVAGSAVVAGATGLIVPACAAGLAPTPSMRGGANNYQPGAAIVERIGNGGFWMTGTVRRAGDGAPLPGQRIQIWAHTTEGYESDPQSHGATLTDAETDDLVAFLQTLTGEQPRVTLPILPVETDTTPRPSL